MDPSTETDLPHWAHEPSETRPLVQKRVKGTSNTEPSKDLGDFEDQSGSEGEESSDEDESSLTTISQGCLLNTFLTINLVTILIALGCIAVQVLSIVHFSATLPYESTATHCYAVLFFILVVCSEMDWTRLFKDLQVLHNWVARGVWYGFLGLLTSVKDCDSSTSGALNAVMYVFGYSMIGIGLLYFLMGIFCLQGLRERRLARYRTLLAHVDLQHAVASEGGDFAA
eukprot:352066_1